MGPIVNGDGGDKNINNTDTIVSIHSADYSDDCSKRNNDGSIESFEFIANDGRTSDYKDVLVTSELHDDNINDNIITVDDDDGNDDDDDNNAENMSGDDNDGDSSKDNYLSDNDNTNSITNPAERIPPWMFLVVMVNNDEDEDDDPDNYNDLRYNFDPDDGVFGNAYIDVREGCVCITLTNSYLPPEEQYNTENILIRPGVFDVDDKPSIHQNFLNSNRDRPYINDNSISNT